MCCFFLLDITVSVLCLLSLNRVVAGLPVSARVPICAGHGWCVSDEMVNIAVDTVVFAVSSEIPF